MKNKNLLFLKYFELITDHELIFDDDLMSSLNFFEALKTSSTDFLIDL